MKLAVRHTLGVTNTPGLV